MSDPHVANRVYRNVFLALLAFTALTFVLSFLPLHALHMPVAMLIAAAKAVLIVLYFMHLIEQRYTNRIVLLVCVLLLGTLIALTVADTATRAVPFFPPEP